MSSQAARLHQLTIASDTLNPTDLYPVAFSWSSAINKADAAQILVFSYLFLDTNACASLLQSSACLTTLSANRTPSHRTGIVQAVNYQHSDGALHFYSLHLVTPEWLLTQSITTRSYVNQSTLDIVTSVLGSYNFDWQLSETLLSSDSSSNTLQQPLALRTQSDISDYTFVTDLLADIGISTLWVAGDSTDNIGHLSLISTFDALALLPLDYNYAQDSIQSGQDPVDELHPVVMLRGSRTVTVRSDGLVADTIFEGMADDDSALCSDDSTVLIAAPSRVSSDADATRLAKLWVAANASHRESYTATGPLRGMCVGAQISITNIPSIQSIDTYCLSSHIIGIEPDSDSVAYSHHTLIKDWLQRTTNQTAISLPTHAYQIARSTGVWVTAQLLDAAIPYCPYPSAAAFASHTYSGLTQARTGTSATPSYASTVTEDGQQQTVTTPVWAQRSNSNSGSADNITPPLRSLQLSSGQTHGWQFAPRDGQPVLLTHWYGDIDSPVISRALYDGIGMGDSDERDVTTRQAGLANRHNVQGGSSPRWHGGGQAHSQINDDDSHSGWISGIAQYGLSTNSEVSLLFDDSPNQIGAQWSVNTGARANAMQPTTSDKATYSPNQHILELGVLRHRYSNHQSSISGQGFTVATDNSLQIMGNQGVLLSTFGIQHTQAEHESAWVNDAGQRQLKFGHELSTTFGEAKVAHLQSTQAIDQSLAAFKDTVQILDETLDTEVLGAPDVLIVSKDSILASGTNTLWTATDIIRQSGSTQSDMVAGDYSLSADIIESLAGVGGQASTSGLHMSANREPLAIQAQGGELRLNSQLGMTIGSESGQVNISSPKRIKLQTSAGASITIDDSGVKLVAPGEITIRAVKKGLVSGAQVNAPVIGLPTSGLFSRRFDFNQLLEAGTLTAGRPYKIINHTKGTELYDVLPDDGRTPRIYGIEQDKIEVIIIGHEDAEELLMIENEIDNSNHDHEDEECCAPEEGDDTVEESQPDSETNLNDDLEDDYYEFGN